MWNAESHDQFTSMFMFGKRTDKKTILDANKHKQAKYLGLHTIQIKHLQNANDILQILICTSFTNFAKIVIK